MHRRLLYLVLSFLAIAQPVYASECSRLPLQNRLIRKITDVRDTVWTWLLMDPANQISYALMRSDELYSTATRQSNESVAYAYVLEAEDRVTRIIETLRNLGSTENIHIDIIERSVNQHLTFVKKMNGNCDWTIPEQFIESNWKVIQQQYYTHLPTDRDMQLFRGKK